MTEASQLTKPRPTQQTAAGSPPYTNKLLQALAVTFQVSFFHLSQVKEYLSFYISMNINSYSGWPFPVCWPPISRLLCLPLLHRLLPGITLLPLLVFLGLSHPYKWREKWALGQLDEVNNHVPLQHQVSPLAHMQTKSPFLERSWTIWKYNAAYYPVSLVKTAELDPKKNHLIACHPHGILCFGAVVCQLSFTVLSLYLHLSPNFTERLRIRLV